MYVLSIKRVKNIFGQKLEKEEWEYATYDNYSGPMSSGYPIFGRDNHAIHFSSSDEAEQWFLENSKYIDLDKYDRRSLGIRKMVFKTIKHI